MTAQLYRCGVKAANGRLVPVDVMASTGDEAGDKALAEFPGGFVASIEPAPADKQPHLKGKVNDGGFTASQAKALGEEALLKQMAA